MKQKTYRTISFCQIIAILLNNVEFKNLKDLNLTNDPTSAISEQRIGIIVGIIGLIRTGTDYTHVYSVHD